MADSPTIPLLCSSQVLLIPNSDWGGEGSLGCGIGYGYLHRIPECHVPSRDPVDPEIVFGLPDGAGNGRGVEFGLTTTPTDAEGPAKEGYADVSF